MYLASPTYELYSLSLHDALPISRADALRQHQHDGDAGHEVALELFARTSGVERVVALVEQGGGRARFRQFLVLHSRSEEHTSELQSQSNLVCRLLLEKKKF